MNVLPLLALVSVVGTYSLATDQLNHDFAPQRHSLSQQVSFNPGDIDDLAVYDLVERAAPALNSPRCEVQAQMASILARDYSEHPVDRRVSGDGLHLVLWGSTEMGTWTLVHDGEDGVACVISSGIGWTHQSTPDLIFANAPLAS